MSQVKDATPNPRRLGVPEQKRIWRPVLTVQIIHNHAKSERFDAMNQSRWIRPKAAIKA
jgi:hypothetical protein